MDGWWAVVVVGAVVFAWTVYLDVQHDAEARLARWWVSRARGWGRWAGPWSSLVSFAAFVGYGALALVGDAVGSELQDPRWALVVTGPALLAYAPFVVATSPVDPSGYRSWRTTLESAGADPREQRRIAWWGGPPSLVGMIIAVLTLVSMFVS